MAVSDSSFYEIPEGRYIRFDKDGMTGSRKYKISGWSAFEQGGYYTSGLPQLGEMWSIYFPYLVVINITCQEMPRDYCDITVEYSSDGMYSSDFMSTELSTDLSSMKIGPGWVWASDYVPLSQDSDYSIPTGRYTIRMKWNVLIQGNFDESTIVNNVNKINSLPFHGFPAETLLFQGANTSKSYDNNGNLTSVDITYNFEFRSVSHNLQFREPTPFKDYKGKEYNYHNDISVVNQYNQALADGDTVTAQSLYYEQAFYRQANDPLLYTKVYAGDGKGKWDTPVINETTGGVTITRPLHYLVDFHTALGIPPIRRYALPS